MKLSAFSKKDTKIFCFLMKNLIIIQMILLNDALFCGMIKAYKDKKEFLRRYLQAKNCK